MPTDYIQYATRTIEIEAKAINDMLLQIDHQFNDACDLLLQCKGCLLYTSDAADD